MLDSNKVIECPLGLILLSQWRKKCCFSTETYNRLLLLCYTSKWQNKIRVIF